MSEDFDSKALEVNLSMTRQENVVLPEDHIFLLSLSESRYGINEYTRDLLFEYHHKYPDNDYINERLRKIAISDFWLYEGCESSERALGIILDLLNGHVERRLTFDQGKDLVRTLVDFTGKLIRSETAHNRLIERSLETLQGLLANDKTLVLTNSNAIKKQFSQLSGICGLDERYFGFYKELCSVNLDYWETSTAIDEWLEKKDGLFSDYSLGLIKKTGKKLYSEYRVMIERAEDFSLLEENIPLYFEFANFYRGYVDKLPTDRDKFHFLVYLLHLPGMSHQTDHLMYDLNVVLSNVLGELESEQVRPFLDEVFDLFGDLKETNKMAVLACKKTIGAKLMDLGDYGLCRYFSTKTLQLGFIGPGPSFQTDEWRMSVDPAHIENIRAWLEIFEYDTDKYRMILPGLTAYLKLGGVLIFDTDLFQKDITRLLNSHVKKDYKLVKQLCRMFPIYFNIIGAEGELRDVTTQMDEISFRQDLLVHFLRKQVHTESNNTHIQLTERIFSFWITGDEDLIKDLVPKDVLDSIHSDNRHAESMKRSIMKVSEVSGVEPEKLLGAEEVALVKWMEEVREIDKKEKQRLRLVCRLYKLLVEKYSFNTGDICGHLRQYNIPSSEKVDELERSLKKSKTGRALRIVLEMMEELNAIIFSEKKTEGWENIYYKRHVAYGIPSMYGAYHEDRFESLGKIFRLEKVAAKLIGDLKKDINLNYITIGSLKKISRVLEFYRRGLKIDGISIKRFDLNLKMIRYSLTSKSFSLYQYLNMFRFIGESIREIIKKYFFTPYDNILEIIIPRVFDCRDSSPKELSTFIHVKSEEFYRDMLSSAFLLQSLDSFISEIVAALHGMVDNYSAGMIRDIMTYDPDMAISPIYENTKRLDNKVFLGNKAFNLKKLFLLGFPVPPGFVITTEIFRRKNTMSGHPMLFRDIQRKIRGHVQRIEKLTGKQFGNKDNPLLLSVRSGAAISMPGAMNTFLNVGVNEELIETLSTKENYGWTAWDCYRRFLQTWGMSNGVKRDVFDAIMSDFKKAWNVDLKIEFKPAQMREIVKAYREAIEKQNIYIEDDPYRQLIATIMNVFNSWNSNLAVTYRKILDIADEWGTAVIVQNMVLGNLNYTSGTGVLFTHADYLDKPGIKINGDYTFLSQGEDIVGGLVNPFPISADQPYRKDPESSLERTFPGIYNKLNDAAHELIQKHGYDHQEMEFTFESQNPDDLFILQVRDQSIRSSSEITVFEDAIDDSFLLGSGIGIGSGVLNGVIIFCEQDLAEIKKTRPDMKTILVRPDTVPDDIGLINECDGLITARGGATSHAAVTASRLGKYCIVNTLGLIVDEKNKVCCFSGVKMGPGDMVALDGNNGCIYRGHYPVAKLK